MSAESNSPDYCWRKALKVSVCALCAEVGFTDADNIAVETLTEALQSYITEAGRSTHSLCEFAGRSQPLVSDAVRSLIEMGNNVKSLEAYSKRPNNKIFMPPLPSSPSNQPRCLQAGTKRSLPPHIPDHFPPFPDPHTYIHTPTNKPPATEYQLIREKAASQKRDVECALTRFIAKTGETETLFSDDPYAYPLIANKPHSLPYLDALLPKEEDLDGPEQEEGSEVPKQKKPPEVPVKEKEEPPKTEKAEEPVPNPEDGKAPATSGTPSKTNTDGSVKTEAEQAAAAAAAAAATETPEGQIDNPYLREIKMPKLKGGGRKNYTGAVKW